jgi:cycloeucalenol cycloisomerase
MELAKATDQKHHHDVGVGVDVKDDEDDIAWKMAAILGTMVTLLAALVQLQETNRQETVDLNARGDKISSRTRSKKKEEARTPSSAGRWLPDPHVEPSKYAYEMFVARYTPAWMAAFGGVVVSRAYERFTAWGYLLFTGSLALPLLLQPVIWPSAFCNSPDAGRPLIERYSFKANLWIAIYSFIGNYWYTHYFYSVLEARYTMPSHRFNNVPIAMYLATHFYFSSYHLLSNILLRKITSRYRPGRTRTILFASVVAVLSYFTAFMETLSISSYPYYSFRDRRMAYTIGSAFYGIYFLVSFPAFYFFDSGVDGSPRDGGVGPSAPAVAAGSNVRLGPNNAPTPAMTAWGTVVDACGNGMLILILLDLVRLCLGVPLVVGRDPADFSAAVASKP